MKTTGKRLIQKIIATSTALIMLTSNLSLIGEGIISYATDTIVEVNNENIEFNAYFKDEKTTEISKTINQKDAVLVLELSVKNDGYLQNGKIQLENNSNFKFQLENNNPYIKQIKEREISLNQINEGEKAILEIPIEFAEVENMNINHFSKENTISLTGVYVNSKNIDKKENAEINGKAKIQVNWKSEENTDSELEAKLITNSKYIINEEEKHIVQISVKSKVKSSAFPIKNTHIELELSKTVANVKVHKRTTSATNGDKDFSEVNYDYKDGILKIDVLNNQNQEISWEKEGNDEYIITMEYPEITAQETSITEKLKKIPVKATLTLYDEKELTKQAEVEVGNILENPVQEIAKIENMQLSKEISKGKIYAGDEKEYSEKTDLYIDYAEAIKSITIEEQSSLYKTEDNEKEANTSFAQTTIDKAQFLKLFGEEGIINIQGQEGNVISTIDASTQANEDGKIIIKYNDGIKYLKIILSEPKAEGKLSLIHEKKILKTNYTREQINKFIGLIDRSNLKYITHNNKNIELSADSVVPLKETETKVSFKADKENLGTIQGQELNFTIQLETDNENKDLYKEPEFKIILPKQVTSVSAKAKLLYGNGLSLKNGTFQVEKENNQIVIKIKLAGEQEKYSEDAVIGPEILVNATIDIDNLVTNSQEEIVLEYTNMNASIYSDNGKQVLPIRIISEENINPTDSEEPSPTQSPSATQGETETNNPTPTPSVAPQPTEGQDENENLNISFTPFIRQNDGIIKNGYNYIYVLNISNQSDKEQKNIQVTINKNDVISIKDIICVIDKNFKKISADQMTFTIDSIPAKGVARIEFNTLIKKVAQDSNKAEIYLKIKDANGKEYETEKIAETVKGPIIEASLESSVPQSEYIHLGEELKYKIKIKNTGDDIAKHIEVEDQISNYLELKEVKINNKDEKYTLFNNSLKIETSLNVGEEKTIDITAEVEKETIALEDIKVSNKVKVYNEGILLSEVDENISYIEGIKKYNEEDILDEIVENNNESSDDNTEQNVEQKAMYKISGIVWNDKNENGIKDEEEEIVRNVPVYAIDIANNSIAKDINGKEASTNTNLLGEYEFSNMPTGKYIILFKYNTEKYNVTTYQADNASIENNSDAIKSDKEFLGETNTVAVTDIIELINNVEHIDLGLKDAKVFSLKLDKVISKIIVTNSAGTKTYNFNDVSLAKAEIKTKNMNGSNVVVEYKMKITNDGEVAGYARTVVDYMPQSLQFNSSINEGWYKQGNNLYNNSLANTKIEPGETKEIVLTLTKIMTGENTGLTNNRAEIIDSYNPSGMQSTDNTENDIDEENQAIQSDEKNISSADLLVTPSTGDAVIEYISLAITIIISIFGTAYVINKKLLLKKIKF